VPVYPPPKAGAKISPGALLVYNSLMQKLGSSEMENVQVIAWTIEIVTLIVALLIAWAVWKISRRAVRNKQAKSTPSKN
jgi:heme/copper-type cytochrome/quinol oxidase subunit 2